MSAIPITVTGASGRMGRMLIAAIAAYPATVLIGATERPGHAWIGHDVGEAMGGAALGVLVEDDLLDPPPGGARSPISHPPPPRARTRRWPR